jgi:hypothetical protein
MLTNYVNNDFDDDLENLTGDPSDIAPHDATEYCMDLNDKSKSGTKRKYIGWRTFVRNQDEENQRYLESLTKKGPDGFSHGSLNSLPGGLFVPSEGEVTFLKWYRDTLLSHYHAQYKPLFIKENNTPVFRLYYDFDFKQRQGVSPDGIAAVGKCAAMVVATFFPTLPFPRYIICTSSYLTTEETDKKGERSRVIKTGMHVHWPDLYVNSEQAFHIRESILASLQNQFGHREYPNNSWNDVLDDKVHDKPEGKKGSGLRMIGSLKQADCPNRNGADCDRSCHTCNGSQRILADGHGRPYWLFLCAAETRDITKENEYRQDILQLLLDTKIRYYGEPTQEFTIPVGAPLYIPKEKTYRKSVSSRAKEVSHSDKKYQVIEEAIRSHLLYGTIVVTNVKEDGVRENKRYKVFVSGTNSRFCQNVNREHRSNHIWFVVTINGVQQRCLDDAETRDADMRYGLCKEYVSSPWPLSPYQKSILFRSEEDNFTGSVIDSAIKHSKTAAELRYLVAFGDRLCKSLYSSSWSAGLLMNNNIIIKQRGEYYVTKGDYIGTNHVEAMKTLGFQVPETEEETMEPPTLGIISLSQLEDKVFQQLDLIIDFVCNQDDINVHAVTTAEFFTHKRKRCVEDSPDATGSPNKCRTLKTKL